MSFIESVLHWQVNGRSDMELKKTRLWNAAKRIYLLAAMAVVIAASAVSVSAATTVYNGVDYKLVYNFSYYVSHNTYIAENYADDPEGAIKYFVKKGMAKRQRASANFDVVSYINSCRNLRREYKNDYTEYYLHFINKGYMYDSYVAKAKAGYTTMQDAVTSYGGINYSRVYNYDYYTAHNKSVKSAYGVDDYGALKHFVTKGMAMRLQANEKFNVEAYMLANPSLAAKFGNNYARYYMYYAKYGKGNLTDPDAAYTVITEDDDVIIPIEDESDDSSSSSTGITDKKLGYTSRKYANATINGRKTLKTYLQNALVPCGRTLYIWGGGWGDTDASIIGYQKSWQTFFNENKSTDYDYKNFRYQYGNGLDCSGYAAWVLYNTLYTKSGGTWLVNQSTTVASKYSEKGWATLSTTPEDAVYKPGDVVSMDGHVWISLGTCSDGSVLVMHSSPKGVQISGTSGRAATLAAHYMKKYFPEWPYQARTVSSGYLNYAGKARWKVNGGILSDPDGIQKMSAEQVMKVLLGS